MALIGSWAVLISHNAHGHYRLDIVNDLAHTEPDVQRKEFPLILCGGIIVVWRKNAIK